MQEMVSRLLLPRIIETGEIASGAVESVVQDRRLMVYRETRDTIHLHSERGQSKNLIVKGGCAQRWSPVGLLFSGFCLRDVPKEHDIFHQPPFSTGFSDGTSHS